jgi:hypothetical protein
MHFMTITCHLLERTYEMCNYFFQGNNASAVPVPSLLGIGGPAAHIAAMHSFMIHPQGIPQPLASPNSGVPQFGCFQSQSTIQPNSHWPNQQVNYSLEVPRTL